MVNWIITANKKVAAVLDELRALPKEERKKDPRVEKYVKNMYKKWQRGTKIERLATLGWMEYESICLFCDILEQLPKLRKQYMKEVQKYGKPPKFRDEDIEKYEAESYKQRKEAEKKAEKRERQS